MTDNQAVHFRELISEASQSLKRSRELLEASIARRRGFRPRAKGAAIAETPSPLAEKALLAWQDFGRERP